MIIINNIKYRKHINLGWNGLKNAGQKANRNNLIFRFKSVYSKPKNTLVTVCGWIGIFFAMPLTGSFILANINTLSAASLIGMIDVSSEIDEKDHNILEMVSVSQNIDINSDFVGSNLKKIKAIAF